MPTPGDKLSSLFKSLRPDDSHLEASTHEAVREAEQRWPLFKALQPAKSVTTPKLELKDRMKWQSPEKPAPRKRKPAASTPTMNEQLAQGLGRMTSVKPVAKRRNVVEKPIPTAVPPEQEALPIASAPVVRRYAAKTTLSFASGTEKERTLQAEPSKVIVSKLQPKAMQGPRVKAQTRAPTQETVEPSGRQLPTVKSEPVLRPTAAVPRRSTSKPVETQPAAVQPPAEDSLLSLFSTVLAPNATDSLTTPSIEVEVDTTRSMAVELPTEVLQSSKSLENSGSPIAAKPKEELDEMTAPTGTEAPAPVVRAKPKRMASVKPIEQPVEIPTASALKVVKPLKDAGTESAPAPKSDSLRSLFGRLEATEQTEKKPTPKKSSFMGRLGKK